jgi:hypothetical protein
MYKKKKNYLVLEAPEAIVVDAMALLVFLLS